MVSDSESPPGDLINLERWPLADLTGPAGRALVAQGQADLARQGFALLPGFLRSEAVARLLAEVAALADQAHAVDRFRPAGSLWPDVRGDWRLPADYVQRYASVRYDTMTAQSPARRLYEWNGLTRLVGALVGCTPYFPMADPSFACLLHMMQAGDRLDWHFDPNDGVAVLTLQAPESGGVFEIAPGVRDNGPETAAMTARLAEVVEGHWPGIHQVSPAPGDFLVFRGHRAMHRVSEIAGATARLNLVCSYTEVPDEGFTGDRTAYGA